MLSNITFFSSFSVIDSKNYYYYFACLPGPCWLYWCKHFKGELMFSVYFSFTLLSIPKWLPFLGILLDTISNGLHSRFVSSIGLLFSKFWRSFITLQYCMVPPPPHAKITSLFSLFRQQFTKHQRSKLDQSQLRNTVSGLFVKLFFQRSRFFLLFRSLIQRNYFACFPGPCWLYWCKHFKGELMFSVYFSFTFLSIPKWLLFLGILRDTISNRLHSHFVSSIGLLFSKFWRSFVTLQYCMVTPPPTLATVFELFGIQTMLWVVVDDAMSACKESRVR